MKPSGAWLEELQASTANCPVTRTVTRMAASPCLIRPLAQVGSQWHVSSAITKQRQIGQVVCHLNRAIAGHVPSSRSTHANGQKRTSPASRPINRNRLTAAVSTVVLPRSQESSASSRRRCVVRHGELWAYQHNHHGRTGAVDNHARGAGQLC